MSLHFLLDSAIGFPHAKEYHFPSVLFLSPSLTYDTKPPCLRVAYCGVDLRDPRKVSLPGGRVVEKGTLGRGVVNAIPPSLESLKTESLRAKLIILTSRALSETE